MVDALQNGDKKIAVIGLGYVGLPVALAFARHCPVIGYDISQERVKKLNEGVDPNGELSAEDLSVDNIEYTAKGEDLEQASFYIVAVPTPVEEHKIPNLNPLRDASRLIGQNLGKGDYVVYESTVFPGCTEEECIPLLEESSGLTYQKDFKVGYSPERINPGDMHHSLEQVVKIVSGCDEESLSTIADIYEMIVEAGVYKAPTIKVAEAAKVIENTQRDVNIALVNELSMIFDRLGINTYDVLEAAATKWNFIKYYPGLVGGHCIGVDPYYLTYKAKEVGYDPQVIGSGRRINDNMGNYVAQKTVQFISQRHKDITQSKVLVMGVTFKENISDFRNTKVVDMVEEFDKFAVETDVVDPRANSEALKDEYGLELAQAVDDNYDAIIVAVNHEQYAGLEEQYFIDHMNEEGVLIDVKGTYKGQIQKLDYWSL